MQRTQVQSLVRELDPTCHNSRSSTATQINIFLKKKIEEWPLLLHLFNTVLEAAARELDKKKKERKKRKEGGKKKKKEKKRKGNQIRKKSCSTCGWHALVGYTVDEVLICSTY